MFNIDHPRVLNLKTPVSSAKPVLVAAPRTAHGQKAAQRIHQSLLGLGARSELLSDPSGNIMLQADSPMIVVGNLADSQCVRELYFRFMCATDLWYPGTGGYELRTLCDPFGTGNNVILIGYSDEDGLRAGTDVFLSRITDPIPHLADLKITRLPMADDDITFCKETPLPKTAWETANTTTGDKKGYLYYLTGDQKLGLEYRAAWKDIIESGYDRTEKMVQVHLLSLMRLLPWRLVEDMGLFNEDERLAIAQFIYGWAESEEGWQHVWNSARVQAEIPRQNHELIPALALVFAADYFIRHFPGISGPEKWLQAAKQAYKPYGPSWKPLCDGLCHGWILSQPVMLEYGLQDPEHNYFEHGGARKAAECAMAVVNNEGWMPSAGDSGLTRQFPGPSLRVAAMYFNDGRYRFVHDLAPINRRLAWLFPPPRTFDTGIQPKIPKDAIGVTVIPVDKLVYEAWERDAKMAPDVVTTPPAAPIEQCFDKLSVRTGWKLEDDYLLIDGLGGGSHSYDDAGGILDYARLGLSLIVSEDSLVHSAPEHHSVVTIARDGEFGLIPGFAILEANESDTESCVYLCLRLKNYAGADWVREIYLQPGGCLVVNDTVIANETGDYAVESHFRIPARLTLNGSEARCKRNSPCVGEVDFRIESLCKASGLNIEEIPVHFRYQNKEAQQPWKDRYHTDEMILTALVARTTCRLNPGESVTLTHLAQVRGPKEAELHLSETGDGLLISGGGIKKQLRGLKIKQSAKSRINVQESKAKRSPVLLFKAGSSITAFNRLHNGTFAVGTEDGKVCLLDKEGHAVWSVDLVGPVHDIGIAGGEHMLMAVGHGPAHLTAFDGNGRKPWTTEIKRDPCPWPWWELPTPAPVQVAGGNHNGKAFFAVGCGDIQIRGFDADGKEQWRRRYNEGVPGRVRVADVDGSGKMSIVAGGEILSDTSCCYILNPEGRRLARLEVEGWTSIMTALAFGKANGRHLIACGANRGTNFHLFEHKQKNVTDENLEGPWERLWLKRLGGQVSGIEIFGPENRVIAGTTQGFLLCYDMEGKVLWSKLFDQGIQHVVRQGKDVLVVDRLGALMFVGLSGNVRPLPSLPGPCSIANGAETVIYFVCGTEVWFLQGI